ncbi:MAG: hypothetical protein ACTSRI_13945 [Promethearchaeota archaeon]
MENKKDKNFESRKDKKEKMVSYLEKIVQDKKKTVAKDLVKLKHVEVKKQEVSKKTVELSKILKNQLLEHDRFENLSNDEITILESFMGKRVIFPQLALIINQSRIPLGIEPLKKDDVEGILDKLISKGYVKLEVVQGQNIYFLSERGKYRVQ